MSGRTDNQGNNKGTARNLKPRPNKKVKGKAGGHYTAPKPKVKTKSIPDDQPCASITDFTRAKTHIKEYRLTGFPKTALKDTAWIVRLEACRYLGYTKKAFNDGCTAIRQEAYRVLGYTKKAFNDPDPDIRLNAYRELGYDKKALKDDHPAIRKTANLLLLGKR